MAQVIVFSELPYPLSGTLWSNPDSKIHQKRTKLTDWRIQPGQNVFELAVWEAISVQKGVKSRLETGRIKANHRYTAADMANLRNPPSRSYISELSCKADGGGLGEMPTHQVSHVSADLMARFEEMEARMNALASENEALRAKVKG